MNGKKEGVQVNRILCFLLVKGICPFAESFCVDKNDNVEEEGAEDKDDAAEDPNGKGGQSSWVGGGWREGRVEHVYQHLCNNTA